MKRIKQLFILLILHALIGATYAQSTPEQQLQKAFKEEKNKVVYLDFWASWCVPCRDSFPWMKEMKQKYESKGLSIITVNVDEDGELAQQFLKQYQATFKTIFDPSASLAESYQLKGMPMSYLIGRDGKLIVSHVGFQKKRKVEYEQAIISALNRN